MFRSIGRRAALAATVGAVGAMSVAPATASAYSSEQVFNNSPVAGVLTPKKLNEPVTLPQGTVFNGRARIEWTKFDFSDLSGTINGAVSAPEFKTTIHFLGIPTDVGITFTQVGNAGGVVSVGHGCATKGVCAAVSVPTKVNIGITYLGPLGLDVPTHCVTSEPVAFNLTDTLTIAELLVHGPHFAGTVTIPPISCEGVEALVVAPILTEEMSGPENPYELSIHP